MAQTAPKSAGGKSPASSSAVVEEQDAPPATAPGHAEASPQRDTPVATHRVPADEQVFSREQALADGFHLVGQPPFVIAGALAASDAQQFTKPELGALVDAFLGREVS